MDNLQSYPLFKEWNFCKLSNIPYLQNKKTPLFKECEFYNSTCLFPRVNIRSKIDFLEIGYSNKPDHLLVFTVSVTERHLGFSYWYK